MPNKISILIAEDDPQLSKELEEIIPKNEFAITITENGKQAFEEALKKQPDVILSDLNMPVMGGSELLQKIRAHRQLHNTYFIVYTSKPDRKISSRLLNLGANDFLYKPINRDELIARLRVSARYVEQIHTKMQEFDRMYNTMDVLLIQDGGCAPGYNPVTAFLTKFLEEKGRDVYVTDEGFRSLVSGKHEDFHRLIYSPQLYRRLEHIRGVIHAPILIEAAGARFRSERYKEFKQEGKVKIAAEQIIERKINAIVGIGGNGTFYGLKDLCKFLPNSVQVFFIPVTVDSDVYGTETIGQHSGVEFGAEKIRSYLSDARSHKRVYIIEMMGAKGGFHALHSCLGAHAHLAVLPGIEYDMKAIANGINHREAAVIVVAEGYKKEKDPDYKGNAAELFREELLNAGIPINKRIVCEPFSRDIRGITPNNLDIVLSQRMAWNVAGYLESGASRIMPAILAEEERAIPFNEIQTDNAINLKLAQLANRLCR